METAYAENVLGVINKNKLKDKALTGKCCIFTRVKMPPACLVFAVTVFLHRLEWEYGTVDTGFGGCFLALNSARNKEPF
jgi:hypothetical protein